MKIVPQKYHIAFVFNTLYYPFTYPEILNSLAARSYVILVPPQPLKSGARIYISGEAAAMKAPDPSKPPCFIDVNEPKKIIACDGTDLSNIMVAINDLVSIIKDDFKLDLREDISFIELSGSAIVFSDNAIDAIKKFSGTQYDTFNEVLGAESAGGSIRIIPKNGVQTDKKWFDISIGQKIPSSGNAYYVEIIFRDGNNLESVLDFISSLDATISSIVQKIGGS